MYQAVKEEVCTAPAHVFNTYLVWLMLTGACKLRTTGFNLIIIGPIYFDTEMETKEPLTLHLV